LRDAQRTPQYYLLSRTLQICNSQSHPGRNFIASKEKTHAHTSCTARQDPVCKLLHMLAPGAVPGIWSGSLPSPASAHGVESQPYLSISSTPTRAAASAWDSESLYNFKVSMLCDQMSQLPDAGAGLGIHARPLQNNTGRACTAMQSKKSLSCEVWCYFSLVINDHSKVTLVTLMAHTRYV
jgi:hypothetical protein